MSEDSELWIGLVHLRPLKEGALEGAAGAYTNILTWATDSEGFQSKAEEIAATMDMHVVEIEDEEPLRQRQQTGKLSEEVDEMLSRAECDSNAIVYGTLHLYSRDDA